MAKIVVYAEVSPELTNHLLRIMSPDITAIDQGLYDALVKIRDITAEPHNEYCGDCSYCVAAEILRNYVRPV